MAMNSGNPTLSDKRFPVATAGAEPMTVGGTVNKTAILLVLLTVSAVLTWRTALNAGSMDAIMPWVIGSAVAGFVVALVTIFKQAWSPWLAPVYALLEGVVIGGLSLFFELRFPGIVLQAVGLTFGTLACLLAAYKSGLIRASENFKLGVTAATGGIAVLYLFDIGLGMFGMPIGFIHESSWTGILFSLFVVVIAALNLVMDFDFIERAAERGAPAYMEWYGAFGLLVTLVWLYLEILRLLAKSRSR